MLLLLVIVCGFILTDRLEITLDIVVVAHEIDFGNIVEQAEDHADIEVNADFPNMGSKLTQSESGMLVRMLERLLQFCHREEHVCAILLR